MMFYFVNHVIEKVKEVHIETGFQTHRISMMGDVMSKAKSMTPCVILTSFALLSQNLLQVLQIKVIMTLGMNLALQVHEPLITV